MPTVRDNLVAIDGDVRDLCAEEEYGNRDNFQPVLSGVV